MVLSFGRTAQAMKNNTTWFHIHIIGKKTKTKLVEGDYCPYQGLKVKTLKRMWKS